MTIVSAQLHSVTAGATFATGCTLVASRCLCTTPQNSRFGTDWLFSQVKHRPPHMIYSGNNGKTANRVLAGLILKVWIIEKFHIGIFSNLLSTPSRAKPLRVPEISAGWGIFKFKRSPMGGLFSFLPLPITAHFGLAICGKGDFHPKKFRAQADSSHWFRYVCQCSQEKNKTHFTFFKLF